jgi:hypothetical protein
MPLTSFRLAVFTNPEVDDLQQSVLPVFRDLEGTAIINGVLLKKQTIDGSTDIVHGLARAPEGWVVVRKRANAVVFDEQDSNPNPAKTIRLNSSAAVVADLWVF